MIVIIYQSDAEVTATEQGAVAGQSVGIDINLGERGNGAARVGDDQGTLVAVGVADAELAMRRDHAAAVVQLSGYR